MRLYCGIPRRLFGNFWSKRYRHGCTAVNKIRQFVFNRQWRMMDELFRRVASQPGTPALRVSTEAGRRDEPR